MEIAKLKEDDKGTSLKEPNRFLWNIHLSKIYDSIISLMTPWSRTEKKPRPRNFMGGCESETALRLSCWADMHAACIQIQDVGLKPENASA
ncbi:hypothetical protein SADUNF_Sadunf08G0096700 [Salix dunnii]|uniref:Uncharacterized protein n=1 Tax=Salix dunnii TaxID=1413687 RepID=A0A835MXR5_9ROSI|nr:hypothetical protein SADUNF_Sadunf08G0096700 [Salix dunnii]